MASHFRQNNSLGLSKGVWEKKKYLKGEKKSHTDGGEKNKTTFLSEHTCANPHAQPGVH